MSDMRMPWVTRIYQIYVSEIIRCRHSRQMRNIASEIELYTIHVQLVSDLMPSILHKASPISQYESYTENLFIT